MRATLAILLTLAASSALAHPGEHHADFLNALGHLLTEPYHLALLALALLVGIAGAALLRRRAP